MQSAGQDPWQFGSVGLNPSAGGPHYFILPSPFDPPHTQATNAPSFASTSGVLPRPSMLAKRQRDPTSSAFDPAGQGAPKRGPPTYRARATNAPSFASTSGALPRPSMLTKRQRSPTSPVIDSTDQGSPNRGTSSLRYQSDAKRVRSGGAGDYEFAFGYSARPQPQQTGPTSMWGGGSTAAPPNSLGTRSAPADSQSSAFMGQGPFSTSGIAAASPMSIMRGASANPSARDLGYGVGDEGEGEGEEEDAYAEDGEAYGDEEGAETDEGEEGSESDEDDAPERPLFSRLSNRRRTSPSLVEAALLEAQRRPRDMWIVPPLQAARAYSPSRGSPAAAELDAFGQPLFGSRPPHQSPMQRDVQQQRALPAVCMAIQSGRATGRHVNQVLGAAQLATGEKPSLDDELWLLCEQNARLLYDV
jgi:hypothetical protein